MVTPASAPKDNNAFNAGIEYLRSLGFTVKTSRLEFPKTGYLSGTDQERAEELNAFLQDPDIDIIFCTRGGYGGLRILPALNYEAVQRNPKLLVGYSDTTALHLALFSQANAKSISGPMVAVEWSKLDPQCEQQFLKLAAGDTSPNALTLPGHHLQALNHGSHEGTLLGGNLSILTRMIGTPYLPNLNGAILFLEDVNEPAYKIDAMLAQLRLSGIWDNLGGLVIGQFTNKDYPDTTAPEIETVFRDYCENVRFPVASGLRYGHIPVKIAMPIGVQARLLVQSSNTSLTLLEPLVATSV